MIYTSLLYLKIHLAMLLSKQEQLWGQQICNIRLIPTNTIFLIMVDHHATPICMLWMRCLIMIDHHSTLICMLRWRYLLMEVACFWLQAQAGFDKRNWEEFYSLFLKKQISKINCYPCFINYFIYLLCSVMFQFIVFGLQIFS